ncbi:MAG: hypothetical protein G01um101466_836 [Parcubacteria group bacterium Gr01-1014_66]|nr:MAG: hypothetical protein G01um101466_836 [Parcubacteria group bacterium Gr01-1014_66]
MKVAMYSLEQTLFEGEAEKLIAHTENGVITILQNHIPLVTHIKGPFLDVVHRGGARTTIQLEQAILEVRPESEVVVLVSS